MKLFCDADGCDFQTTDARALGRHNTSQCKFRLEAITTLLTKRKAEVEDIQAFKKARLERQREHELLVNPGVDPLEPRDLEPREDTPPLPAAHVSMNVPSPAPYASPLRRQRRRIRLPKRLQEDYVPTNPLPSQYDELAEFTPSPSRSPVALPLRRPAPYVEDAEDEHEAGVVKEACEEVIQEVYEDCYESVPNGFGVFRRYFTELREGWDPEASSTVEDRCDAPGLPRGPQPEVADHASIRWLVRAIVKALPEDDHDPEWEDVDDADEDGDGGVGPFPNCSQFRLVDWWYGQSGTKSMADFDDLLDVLDSDGFALKDLKGFNAAKAEKLLADFKDDTGFFSKDDAWCKSTVHLSLPLTRSKHKTEARAPKVPVEGLVHRKLLDLIEGAVTDKTSRYTDNIHWHPHELHWYPADQPEEPSTPRSSQNSTRPPPEPLRVYTDCYNSRAMLEEDANLRNKPRNPDDDDSVEYAILPLLLWSDATHLSSFGSAALWPIYVYFGNLSKYVRGRPTEFAAQHLAYIPELPDSVKDKYAELLGKHMSPEVLKFLRRDLYQQIWLLLLDKEFMHAYEHGIVLKCADGVVRRLFPRIFTYSADYPEKVIACAMKPLGRRPCPRCLITQKQIAQAGKRKDMARRKRHKRCDTFAVREKILRARRNAFKGRALRGKFVNGVLDDMSLTPIQSAFSVRLSQHDVNFYELFAPDLMHEFELGVWKGTFAHLLRLLQAQGKGAIEEFNARMRHLPTFGRDRIRRFAHDVAGRKKLAARDYEAYLLVVMPVFEGLLPLRDDQNVADLLFECANWHALAKLRLHTDATLDIFQAATQQMYRVFRKFERTTCMRHKTRELPKEAEARLRREQAKTGTTKGTESSRKEKRFNVINTFKFHSLGDYVEYIKRSGPTDNYTTQVGELEHRHIKRFYVRTNRVRFVWQLASKNKNGFILRKYRRRDRSFRPRRQRILEAKNAMAEAHEALDRAVPTASSLRSEPAVPAVISPVVPYEIGKSRNSRIKIYNWLAEHEGDPAIENFLPLLREHLLGRILGDDAGEGGQDSDICRFSRAQHRGLRILDNHLFEHQIMRRNYTTYDMRRDQDSINPRTHPDVMLHADSADGSDHPFCYARVIKIVHADVCYDGPGATAATRRWRPMEVLWVRWFELDRTYSSGFQHRRLPRVQFVDEDAEILPFGFIDPEDVIRASYLMPAFDHGETNELLGPSPLARRPVDEGADFMFHYVCTFVDRDMYMRYLGGGVGHREQHVPVTTSYRHAERIKRTTSLYREGTAGCRVTGKQVIIDEDEDFDGRPDEESDSDASEDSDSDLDDSDADGNSSDSSVDSGGSMADFYGLTRHDRASPRSDPEPGSSEDEQDEGLDEDEEALWEMAAEVDVEVGEVEENPEGDEAGGNVENDEDYYMDDVYEHEGYARL